MRLNQGEILQEKCFQYFDRSKTRHDRAKIGFAGQHDRPPFKNYFEPCFLMVILYLAESTQITVTDCLQAVKERSAPFALDLALSNLTSL